MNTDELIKMLAEGEDRPPPRRGAWALILAIAAGLVIAAGLLLSFDMVRPDIGTAMMPVMMKAGFAAAIAAACLPLLVRLARPGRPLGAALALLGGFAICTICAFVIAMMGAEPSERMSAFLSGNLPWCVLGVPLLAAPAAALLFWFMRGLAPTNLAGAGAAIGAVSGGVGAMAYAMYCPTDSMGFVTLWYSIAIAFSAVLGAILGARLLRW